MKSLISLVLFLQICVGVCKEVTKIETTHELTADIMTSSLPPESPFSSFKPSIISSTNIITTTEENIGTTSFTITTISTSKSSIEPILEHKPCYISDSILFTREDVPVGTVLLEIPTMYGETWRLQDTGSSGEYLVLEATKGLVRVVFKQTPDIEDINANQKTGSPREKMSFILHCFYHGWTYKYRQELIIHDVNEHAPVFDASRSYNISISEASPIGTIVFSLRNLAWDPDATGRVAGYVIRPFLEDHSRDGRRTFRISDNGDHVILFQPLDYDELALTGSTLFFLNITALDNGLPSPLTSHVVLSIDVTDADDQDPVFWYLDCPMVGNRCATPYFQAITRCGYKGPLHLYPGPIVAFDPDSINNTVSYSIKRVDPDKYKHQFDIDSQTGEVRLLANSCSASVRKILLTVKATEESLFHRSVSTTLQVDILDNAVFSNHGSIIPTIHGALLDSKNINDRARLSNGNAKSDYTSLPVVFFVLSIFGFVAIGGGLAFAIIQISKKRRKKNIKCTRKSSEDSYTSDCGGCGKSDKSDNGSVVTSFATRSSGATAGSFINRCFEGNDTQSSESKGPKTSSGSRNQEQNQNSSSSSSNSKPFHDQKENSTERNESQSQNTQEEYDKVSKPQIIQKQCISQSQQNQDQTAPKSNTLDQHSSPQPQSPFPYSSDLFIQRRNLFQQQECRQHNGQYPPPPPPPLPLPRPRDQPNDEFNTQLPSPDSYSHHQNQQYHQNHNQQQQQHQHHYGQNFDDPWIVLEEPEDDVEFNLQRATPGHADTTSFLRGSNNSDSMKHDRGSQRVNLKKACTFKEQLNKMVPECLNVNNLGYMSASANLNAAHSSNLSGNLDTPGVFRSLSGNLNQKVRFNMN